MVQLPARSRRLPALRIGRVACCRIICCWRGDFSYNFCCWKVAFWRSLCTVSAVIFFATAAASTRISTGLAAAIAIFTGAVLRLTRRLHCCGIGANVTHGRLLLNPLSVHLLVAPRFQSVTRVYQLGRMRAARADHHRRVDDGGLEESCSLLCSSGFLLPRTSLVGNKAKVVGFRQWNVGVALAEYSSENP